MKKDVTEGITILLVIGFVVYIIEEHISDILIFFGVIILCVLLFIIFRSVAKAEKRQQELAEEEEARKRYQKKIKSTQSKIDKALNGLIAEYGKPDRVIRPEDKSIYGYFALFVNHKVIYINDIAFPFADIASYKLVDNCQITKGNISGSVTTSADTKDVVISSLAGDFWGGKTGAIIGGATAQKHSSVNLVQNNDTLVHDYTLLINLKGINREGIEMHIGDDWRLAAELEHLFDQIIKESNPSMP